eukprot:14269054-Alexandrium_andersonii.AAC.1
MEECPLDVYELQLHARLLLSSLEPYSLRRCHAEQKLQCLERRGRRAQVIPLISYSGFASSPVLMSIHLT